MSFTEEFTFCMHGAYLPTPDEAVESVAAALEFLEHLHTAAEAAGGVEITLASLEAAGFVGLGVIAEDAAAVTVAAYAGAVAGCMLAGGGSVVWDLLAQEDASTPVVRDVVAAAVVTGVEVPEGFAVA